MGSQRSLVSLAKKTGIDFETLKEWSEAYAWDEMITARNREIERAFEAHYMHKSRDIRNRLVTQMESLLNEMEASSLGLPFAITSVADLRALSQAYESLVRANTLAMTKAVDMGAKGSAPKTWSDLLEQSDVSDGETN